MVVGAKVGYGSAEYEDAWSYGEYVGEGNVLSSVVGECKGGDAIYGSGAEVDVVHGPANVYGESCVCDVEALWVKGYASVNCVCE